MTESAVAKLRKRTDVRPHVEQLIESGFEVVPLGSGSKTPIKGADKWPQIEYTFDDFKESYNVGVKLGNWIDIDLDCLEAQLLAPVILPVSARFKRDVLTHYIYQSDWVSPIKDLNTQDMPKIIEVRSEQSMYTMFPPSLHPGGVRLEWIDDSVQKIDGPELFARAKILAACCRMFRVWTDGNRDIMAIIVANLLQQSGFDVEDSQAVVNVMIDHDCDPGDRNKLREVAATIPKKPKPYGLTKLREYIGDEADKVRDWLGLEDWPEPGRLVPKVGEIPKWPEKFFPPMFNRWAKDVAKRQSSHVDFVSAALIVSVATAGGARLKFQAKQNDELFTMHCNMWAACVGDPGQLKTPAINEGLIGIMALERAARDVFKAEMLQYAKDLEEYKNPTPPKEGEEPKPHVKPEKPDRIRIVIDDPTIEGYAKQLEVNPQGSLLHFTELAGLMKSAGQYKAGGGNDIEFWLKCNDGGPHQIVRADELRNVDVESCYASIVGSIQPEVAAQHLINEDRQANGFAARFGVMVWPEEIPFVFVDTEPDREARQAVTATIQQIRTDFSMPTVLAFSPDATNIFATWLKKNKAEIRVTDSPLKQHYAKADAVVIKLAGIHFLMTGKYQQTVDCEFTDGTETVFLKIPEASVAAAIDLMENYIKPHATRVYGMLDADPRAERAQVIFERLIQGKGMKSISAGNVTNRGWKGLNSAEEVSSVFRYMQDRGYGTYYKPGDLSGAGRRGHTFKVSPRVI